MLSSFFWVGKSQGLFLHPAKKMADDLVAQLVEHPDLDREGRKVRVPAG